MFKKYLTLTLAVLVFNLACGSLVFAQTTNDEKAAKRTEKLKAQIAKLGTGKDARVNIRLSDGSKISGYVSQINENSFVVVSNQSGAATEIQYSDATKFSRYRPHLSLTQRFLIATGAVLGVGAIICLASKKCVD